MDAVRYKLVPRGEAARLTPMFSIPHLVIIFVVVLVVFGPEKLPELARNLGKILGEFRRATGDLQNTFEGHLRDIERESSLRHTATGAGATTDPVQQDTTGPPKTDSASGPKTVPAIAQKTDPAGVPKIVRRNPPWTRRAARPNSSAGEKDQTPTDSSAKTDGSTQADVTPVQTDAVEQAQERPGPEQASAAAAESGHEKGSDGGHPN
jgi:TatA/E family protein of Tat protein translocase